jgi:hypothetical protein
MPRPTAVRWDPDSLTRSHSRIDASRPARAPGSVSRSAGTSSPSSTAARLPSTAGSANSPSSRSACRGPGTPAPTLPQERPPWRAAVRGLPSPGSTRGLRGREREGARGGGAPNDCFSKIPLPCHSQVLPPHPAPGKARRRLSNPTQPSPPMGEREGRVREPDR